VNYEFRSYHGGGDHRALLPYPAAKELHVPGAVCANADCDAGEDGQPLRVAGVKGTGVVDHDTTTCEAGCLRCGKTIGRIVAKACTIFGIEEDARVAQRCRVY
jgi:hypothetical protein